MPSEAESPQVTLKSFRSWRGQESISKSAVVVRESTAAEPEGSHSSESSLRLPPASRPAPESFSTPKASP